MKKYRSVLITAMLIIIYAIVWCSIMCVLNVAYHEGVLSVISDAFGSWYAVGLAVFAGISMCSMIILRLFEKKEHKIQVIAYTMTIIFCIAVAISVNVGTCKFNTFTTERWKSYPSRRLDMYWDLNETYNISGWTEDEIIVLLGNPDTISNETYVYCDGYGNSVYVYFESGLAQNFGYVT